MKYRIVSVILALFLVLPLCPALSFTASADPVNTPEFSGSGTEIDPWIIADAAGWAQFAADVNAGTSAGGYYKLAEDFDNTDSPVTVTVGTAEHPFSGVLDGGGRTLNVAIIDSENVTAPFRYASGATIENLTVMGTVSGNKYTAGLIGDLNGNCTVRNCRIGATLAVSGSAIPGGFVGFAHNASLTVLNSVFSGVLHHEGDTHGFAGGLVGWSRNMDLQIDGFLFVGKCTGGDFYCFHPVALTIAGAGGTVDVHDVYYTEAPSVRQNCEVYIVTNEGTRLYTSENSLIRPSRAVLGYACGAEDDVASVDVPPEIDYTGQVIDTDGFFPRLPDGTLLTKDVDYTVSVSPSTVLEPGMYTLTYTGIGNYRGTLSAQFYVSKDQRILTAADTVWQDGATYFVSESLTIGSRITVEGAVRLYLCAGVQLSAPNGIDVPAGASLTIDAQDDSGKLTANLGDNNSYSAIGAGNTDDCGNITINGGSVTVSSHGQAAAIGTRREGSSGSITINGGRIKATATGGGAAIGAGYWHASASVTINGGVITAEANARAAIGSAGYSSSVVVINGGTITAKGTPGIGCGDGGTSNVTINGGIIDATGIGCGGIGAHADVTINGGTVTSAGTTYAAGIGPFRYGSTAVTINGGNISATGGRAAFGIEGSPLTLGWTEDTDSVYASSYGGEIVFAEHKNFARADNGDVATVTNIDGVTIVPFNGTPRAITINDPAHGAAQLSVNTAHEGQVVTVTWSCEYPYILDECTVSGDSTGYPFTRTGQYSGFFVMPDEDVNVLISTFQAPNLTVNATEGSVECAPLLDNRTNYDSGWYAVTGNVEMNERMVASGDVKIWLCDGAELICRRGIQVLSGNSLTIEGTGRLVADASSLSGCAGIGGNNKNGYPYGGGGTVIIRGGVIEAYGGDQAAGIGGCRSGGCDAVTITGGKVEAYGEWLAAGIGGGYEGNGGEISITGGQVTAIGGKYARGIGGGYQSGGADILLSWTTIYDYIEANGYNGTVNVAEGKIFLRGDTKERIKPEKISELGLCRMVPRYGTEYTLYFKADISQDTLRYDLVEGEMLRITPSIEYPAIFAGYEAVDVHQNQVSFTEIENHGFEIVMPAYTVYATLHLTQAESTYIETSDGNNKYYMISPDYPCLGSKRYYVPTDLTITERLVIEDTAVIYLCEGATLTCAKGITVAEGCALQIEGEGALIADGRSVKYSAGIGGEGVGAPCGKIFIKGGSVSAYGGQTAAGIGCGAFGDGGAIAIYGGQVTAVGGKDGVGVGGNAVYVGTDEVFTDIVLGWSSPDDFIDASFGGRVSFAEDNYLMLRDTGELATRENYAGHVLAPYTGAMYALEMTPIPTNQSSAYFYSAADHVENDLTPPALVPAGITVTVAAVPVYPYDFDGVTLAKQSGGTEQAALLRLESLITYYTFTMPADNVTLNAVMTELQPVTRETPEGTFSFMPLRAYHNIWSSDDYGLNYVLDRDIDAGTRGFVVWEGQAKLYLDAGATLTCSAIRMERGEGITIYGEGTLNVDGSQFTFQGVTGGPGIGPGNITIYGGNINAKGDESNPGIGSCIYVSKDSVASSVIAIHGGNITAYGGYWGTAAIGCGYRGGVDSITITGGSINAVGGHWFGAGIGGSMMNECANIVISGGNIRAIGYNGGAGIGGGGYARGGDITITGGVIFAQSVENERGCGYGAGIGDGTQASGAHIVITGGQITAVGGTRQDLSQPGFPNLSSAGIGSGWKSGNDDEITIGWTGRDDYIDAGPTGFGGTVTFVQGDGFLFEGTNVSATPGSAGDGRLVPYVENADLTPPEVKTGLVYTGQAQALIDEGSSTGGTLKYCLSSDRPDDGDYQTSVPTAVAAGTYKVWYKAFGDASHNDSDAAFLYVTVGRKSVTVTLALSEDEYIYDRTAKEPTVTVYANGAVIDPDEYTVAYSDNIPAGEAAVTVEGRSDGNYSFTGGATFTILRRHITVSGLSAENKEYDGITRAAVVGTPLLEGLIDGDKVTLMDGFAEFYTPDPGIGKPVYFWSFAIDGPDADNYYFDEQPEDVTADITVEAIGTGDTLIESNGGVIARLFTPATNDRYRFAADSETYPAIFIYDGEDEIYDGFMGANTGFFNFSLELEGGKDYLILLVTSYTGTLTLTVEPAVAYTITVDDCIEGGEIYCDEEYGIEGQWIEIGTGAFGGYELIEWTVTTESGDPVDKEEHGFYMPASNVTVSARFGPLREFTFNFAGELSENDVEITVQINGDAVDPGYVYAAEGQTVTLLVTFAGRYTLDASVRSDGGTNLPCTVGAVSGGWRVTFTMPDEEAAITLTTTPAASTDLNCDGVTNIGDVTVLLDFLAGTDPYIAFFDLDGNNSVTISDVTMLLDILAGN